MDCTEAVEQILHCETVETLLAEDAVMEIGVIGTGDAQSERMLAAVESCTAQTANTYCYAAHTEEAEEAHALGLSCGKYRALRALQEVDPSVTADAVRDMSMREIRDRLAAAIGRQRGYTDRHGNAGASRRPRRGFRRRPAACKPAWRRQSVKQRIPNRQIHGLTRWICLFY